MSLDKRERERRENWSENLTEELSEERFEECSVRNVILFVMENVLKVLIS